MQLAEKSEAAGAQQRKKDREGLRETRRNEGGKDEDEKRRRKIKDTFMTLDLQTGELPTINPLRSICSCLALSEVYEVL